jgi:hypothetical protein
MMTTKKRMIAVDRLSLSTVDKETNVYEIKELAADVYRLLRFARSFPVR